MWEAEQGQAGLSQMQHTQLIEFDHRRCPGRGQAQPAPQPELLWWVWDRLSSALPAQGVVAPVTSWGPAVPTGWCDRVREL